MQHNPFVLNQLPPKKRPKYSVREKTKIIGACLFALLIGGMIAIIPIMGFELVISAIEYLHRH